MSVVYLIGGCSRSGKSTLALRLLRQKNIPLLSTDVLDASFRDLGEIQQNLSDNGRQSNQVVQQLLEPMIAHTIVGHAPYTFEGIHLAPRFLRSLMERHEGQVRVCVLGFPDVTVDAKMNCVGAVPFGKADWLREHPYEYQRTYLRRQRIISRKMRSECQQHGLPFVDTGTDFACGVEKAYRQLLAACTSR